MRLIAAVCIPVSIRRIGSAGGPAAWARAGPAMTAAAKSEKYLKNLIEPPPVASVP